MKTRLDTINKCLVLHDVSNILKNGFNIMVDDDNNVIKDFSKMFDRPIKMIHSTGTYKVVIEKIEI